MIDVCYQLKLDRLKAALAPGIEEIRNGEVVQFTAQDIIDELDKAS